MLEVGQPFPEFSLQDQHGQIHTRESLVGAKTIVYFYPKDDTSGCTKEACEFRDLLPRFEGARVIGVSPDDVKSHKKFADKYDLGFVLLADVEQQLCQACGVWVEKSMYGKKYMGVERTTFLLDENANVARVWNKVKPEGHAEAVRAAL
jgi:peroxiredoxin Q/BCP